MRGGLSSDRHPGGSDAGMTLIEMLIVLAVIGVAAAAVSLGIGAATRSPTAESEARRFAGRLQAAADDALLGDRLVALTVTKSGYGFVASGATGWTPLPGEGFAYHAMPGGMVMSLNQVPPVILGTEGAGQPLQALVSLGQQRWLVQFDGLSAQARPAPAGLQLLNRKPPA
jgi:general secretion pathway protein H